MIEVEIDVPDLDAEDWHEVARALQWAIDRTWPSDDRRPAWIRLRNLALECAAMSAWLNARDRVVKIDAKS